MEGSAWGTNFLFAVCSPLGSSAQGAQGCTPHHAFCRSRVEPEPSKVLIFHGLSPDTGKEDLKGFCSPFGRSLCGGVGFGA